MSYNVSSNSIDTPFLRIRKNCLEIQNTTIQISNISFVNCNSKLNKIKN